MGKTLLLLAVLLAAWFAALAIGQHRLLQYQSRATEQEDVPGDWPRDSTIRPTQGNFTLLLFVHPHCPCTRATLGELSWVTSRTGGNVAVLVVFVCPPGATDGWERGRLWDKAAAIPGVQAITDGGGREARRFGVRPPAWRCCTIRGIDWSSAAASQAVGGTPATIQDGALVLACLTNSPDQVNSTPVFGCPLFDEGSP